LKSLQRKKNQTPIVISGANILWGYNHRVVCTSLQDETLSLETGNREEEEEEQNGKGLTKQEPKLYY
jgi:hypothetical protein